MPTINAHVHFKLDTRHAKDITAATPLARTIFGEPEEFYYFYLYLYFPVQPSAGRHQLKMST